MNKQKNYIKYFTNNVDEFELMEYMCEAVFYLTELTGISEDEIYKKYDFDIDDDDDSRDRKALYNMLKDIEKIDPRIPYKNYFLNYFEMGDDICPQTKL